MYLLQIDKYCYLLQINKNYVNEPSHGALQCTEDEHPDKAAIIKAIRSMTDVATAINEYKRRKDLGMYWRIVTVVVFISILDMLPTFRKNVKADYCNF